MPRELVSESSFNQARILQSVSGGYHDWSVMIEQSRQTHRRSCRRSSTQPASGCACVKVRSSAVLARDMHKAGLQRQPEDLFDGDLLEVPVVHWYPTDQPQTYFSVVINGGGDAFTRSSTSTLPVKEEVATT